MSTFIVVCWLLFEGVVILAANMVLWGRLGAWFGGEGKPNTLAFTFARLAVLFTFTAWLTAAILITEGRSVLGGPEMAPIHWLMSPTYGAAMLFADALISLLTPFIVIAAMGCGATAVLLARGGNDQRSVWLGSIGMGLNGLLLLGLCVCCSGMTLWRKTPVQTNTPAHQQQEMHDKVNRVDRVHIIDEAYIDRGIVKASNQSINLKQTHGYRRIQSPGVGSPGC